MQRGLSIKETYKGALKYFDIKQDPNPNYCFEKAKLFLLNYDKLDEVLRREEKDLGHDQIKYQDKVATRNI